jgi:hypothetical protein
MRSEHRPWGAFTTAGLLFVALACHASLASAGQTGDAAALSPVAAQPSLMPDAPLAPVAPATIARDGEGRATVRAVRLEGSLNVDGRLDEAHYAAVPPMSDFIQIEPQYDVAATERTDLWVSFDDDNLYLSARMWDTNLDQLMATEMRRDSQTLFQGNDVISFILDTFYDQRSGVMFTVNPIGGRSDTQVTGERQFNQDWNPVWDVKTGRFEGGWSAELAIPFKSLRYGPGRTQVWGFNAMRNKRSKNEMSMLTRVPLGRNQAAITQTSFAASLVGLEAPPSGRTLDLKPYVTSSLTTDRTATPAVANDPHGEVGLDLKYSLTKGLTADVTVNTDFAQVEADEQQVNLTRFNLFFPEKREFFLENQGTFSFGGIRVGGNFNNSQNNSDAPILFYSRRIGLNEGREVPLEAGGRVTGRAGRYSLGVLNAQTGEESDSLPLAARSTNFSVVRLNRDVLSRSSIGLMATGRSVAANGVGRNLVYGVDGTFLFYENLAVNTYWARSETDGRDGDDTSYRGEVNYNGDRYGVQIERLMVGDAFNPELGFLRRGDFRRSYAQVRFSPRPSRFRSIRRFRYQGNIAYVESGDGVLESREREGEFVTEFQNGDQVNARYTDSFEFLAKPFQIAPGIVLPVGSYAFSSARLGFNLARQHKVSGNVSLEYGTFYNGHRTSLGLSQGRVSVTNALSFEPTYSLNKVTLEQGRFTSHLLGSRVTYTMTPLMFVSALVQYSSSSNAVSTNARLRWEYRPGSELFVVYNETRDTLSRSFPETATRALVIKINRLMRF